MPGAILLLEIFYSLTLFLGLHSVPSSPVKLLQILVIIAMSIIYCHSFQRSSGKGRSYADCWGTDIPHSGTKVHKTSRGSVLEWATWNRMSKRASIGGKIRNISGLGSWLCPSVEWWGKVGFWAKEWCALTYILNGFFCEKVISETGSLIRRQVQKLQLEK